jgi:hypothetical protein
MPDVTLRAGKEYLVMPPDRRADLNRLVAQLRSAGINADLRVQEYAPNRRGVGLLEPDVIAIGIGSAAALCSRA